MENTIPKWAVIAVIAILAICGGFFIAAQRKKLKNEAKVEKMLNDGKITFALSEDDKEEIIKGVRR